MELMVTNFDRLLDGSKNNIAIKGHTWISYKDNYYQGLPKNTEYLFSSKLSQE
jgi:hypothetical protein